MTKLMTMAQILHKYRDKIGVKNGVTRAQSDKKSDKVKTGIDINLLKSAQPFELKSNNKTFQVTLNVQHRKYVLDKKAGENLPEVTLSQYKTFLKKYFELILYRILEEGFVFIAPYYLGRFYFRKSNRVPLDPEKNKYYRNLHSFRKFFNIKWDKQTAYFKSRTIWKFVPNKKTKKAYAKRVFRSVDPYETKPLIAYDHNERKWT